MVYVHNDFKHKESLPILRCPKASPYFLLYCSADFHNVDQSQKIISVSVLLKCETITFYEDAFKCILTLTYVYVNL